ncbi:hypothetical protein [Glycomyces tenuis]|uniref:hypothetical protein n=1 Tax=Glycomyces tenuis TaxID=58116 RepID=UPI0012DF165B|nr:hypothetical protein [Glycomyces tenuis]
MVRFDIRPANGGGFLWRLLSGNNRTMATGGCQCATRAECTAQMRRVAEVALVKRPRLVHEDDGTWSWSLDDGGEAIARSAAPYSRRIDCLRAIDRFVDLADDFQSGLAEAPAARPPRRGA